jgi:CubicO group peptidase (beta-lactamase class C family)
MICPPQFAPVRKVFDAALADGEELGARFTVTIDGEVALDLYGGFADRARTQPFDAQTLTPVFSTTKAIAALLIARLVDSSRLAYEAPVAGVWPEFAAAGKGEITVGQVLSHQAGLSGFVDEMDPALWFDWDAICAKLAAMAPLWPPGTASGYHPVTFGYLAGEIFRRVDGRDMGQALREDIAEPFGLDLWIGLPDREFGRVAQLQRPTRFADFGKLDDVKRAAFLTKWAAPGGRGGDDWRFRPGPADERLGLRRAAGWPRPVVARCRRRGHAAEDFGSGSRAAVRDRLGRGLHAQRPASHLWTGNAELRPLRLGRLLRLCRSRAPAGRRLCHEQTVAGADRRPQGRAVDLGGLWLFGVKFDTCGLVSAPAKRRFGISQTYDN